MHNRVALLITGLLVLAPARAFADEDAEARQHNQKAMAAYALANYAEAAAEYEKAFAAKPMAALLYNAAQSYRRAGNKERALTLYQNYLRVFGPAAANREGVQRLIVELQEAIESERRARSSPPTETDHTSLRGQAGLPEAKSAEPAPKAAVTPTSDKPLVKKAWFWAVIGSAAAVVIAGVAVGVVLGTADRDPQPSYGSVGVE